MGYKIDENGIIARILSSDFVPILCLILFIVFFFMAIINFYRLNASIIRYVEITQMMLDIMLDNLTIGGI